MTGKVLRVKKILRKVENQEGYIRLEERLEAGTRPHYKLYNRCSAVL